MRFAWWSGEEWGLLGSTHWVNGLVAADPAVINRLAAYVNVNMIASPNYVIGVYDGDGATFPNEELPTGSADLKRLYTSYFDAIGQAWVDIEMRSSSDHAAFMPSGYRSGACSPGPVTPSRQRRRPSSADNATGSTTPTITGRTTPSPTSARSHWRSTAKRPPT